MNGPGKGANPEAWQEAIDALADGAAPNTFVSLAAPNQAARKGVAVALSGAAGEGIRERLADSLGLATNTPAERLLRLAAGRQEQARRRGNPIVINDGFDCAHCGFAVPPAPGSAVRNHCPRCLRTVHLDEHVPGDRLSNCLGIMDPEQASLAEGVFRVTHRCRRCGFCRRNRLATDWAVEPDRTECLWPDPRG